MQIRIVTNKINKRNKKLISHDIAVIDTDTDPRFKDCEVTGMREVIYKLYDTADEYRCVTGDSEYVWLEGEERKGGTFMWVDVHLRKIA